MLYRKFASQIESHLLNQPNKILLVNGARQIGKSYLIRYVGKKLFRHFVEINLKEDKEGAGLFAHVRSMDDFHIQLGEGLRDRYIGSLFRVDEPVPDDSLSTLLTPMDVRL